jgi:Zn-dependent protease
MRLQQLRFSPAEVFDLVKAWLATALAFALFFSYGTLRELNIVSFLILVLVAALTAGVGFLLHELMHKIAAHRFGVHSEFRSHDMMLVVMIILAFLGLIFAAPGAVYFTANTTRRERGIISLAGPATNMALAILFLPLTVFSNPIVATIGAYGFFINAFLGAFNLIPFMGLDGEKVMHWSKPWYFVSLFVAGVLVVFAFVTVGGV